MKFSIALTDLESMLRAVLPARMRKADTLTIAACAARCFVASKVQVGGMEALVFRDGGVRVPAKAFSEVIKTYKGTPVLVFEADAAGLRIQNFHMPVLAYDPAPKPPGDFQEFPTSAPPSAAIPQPRMTSVADDGIVSEQVEAPLVQAREPAELHFDPLFIESVGKPALRSALQVIKAAIDADKSALDAIEEGIAFLRANVPSWNRDLEAKVRESFAPYAEGEARTLPKPPTEPLKELEKARPQLPKPPIELPKEPASFRQEYVSQRESLPEPTDSKQSFVAAPDFLQTSSTAKAQPAASTTVTPPQPKDAGKRASRVRRAWRASESFLSRFFTAKAVLCLTVMLLLASWVYPPGYYYSARTYYSERLAYSTRGSTRGDSAHSTPTYSHGWFFLFDTESTMRVDFGRLILLDAIIAVLGAALAWAGKFRGWMVRGALFVVLAVPLGVYWVLAFVVRCLLATLSFIRSVVGFCGRACRSTLAFCDAAFSLCGLKRLALFGAWVAVTAMSGVLIWLLVLIWNVLKSDEAASQNGDEARYDAVTKQWVAPAIPAASKYDALLKPQSSSGFDPDAYLAKKNKEREAAAAGRVKHLTEVLGIFQKGGNSSTFLQGIKQARQDGYSDDEIYRYLIERVDFSNSGKVSSLLEIESLLLEYASRVPPTPRSATPPGATPAYSTDAAREPIKQLTKSPQYKTGMKPLDERSLSAVFATPSPSPITYVPIENTTLFNRFPDSQDPGTLAVNNGTECHAIAKLIDMSSNLKVCSFVVLANSVGGIAHVPNGHYRLIFAFGDAIIKNKDHFAAASGFAEFNDRFDYVTTRTITGVEYSTFRVTLHKVVGGNAPTGSITEEEFSRY